MDITEVRVKMVSNGAERLRAFCSVTLDGAFVVRDLKVIDGINGPFVAMPSRKLADRCPKCGSKNHLRARFCNECGAKLRENRASRDPQGRVKLHVDVAHPINSECRQQIQAAVIDAYQEEKELARQPDYQPRYTDLVDDEPEEVDLSECDEIEADEAQVGAEEEEDTGYDELIADLKRRVERKPNGSGGRPRASFEAAHEDEAPRPPAKPEPTPRPRTREEPVAPPPAADEDDGGFAAGIL